MLELNATASPPGSTPPEEPGEDQQAAGVGILLQISMLVLSFVVGHVLRRHKFYYLPEASVSLLIGDCIRCLLLFSVSRRKNPHDSLDVDWIGAWNASPVPILVRIPLPVPILISSPIPHPTFPSHFPFKRDEGGYGESLLGAENS
ncbi:hypothetical protein BHE74_00050109 [Ensete ventricosum]|uniref:Cation/H+ exchanger domain-containing protein n=1 Tax=Ensete ventricosum TaxID=4639 RepID=A0A426XFQ6_ENSVE|nr:hypothetical protein B296_00049965 [Ensete ventricosum]RWW44159.1 hypothetical protein BHE74_00050109 [Ensete ventricosum]RZS22744.1 hypothetical protein BHM03_00055567 [Ensete ventricosum]